MSERMKIDVMGRHIGTASGWDEVGDSINHFYDFQPAPGLAELACDGLTVHYQSGLLEGFAPDGSTVIFSKDAIETLKNVPKAA